MKPNIAISAGGQCHRLSVVNRSRKGRTWTSHSPARKETVQRSHSDNVQLHAASLDLAIGTESPNTSSKGRNNPSRRTKYRMETFARLSPANTSAKSRP